MSNAKVETSSHDAKATVKAILENYDAFLFDCDGTLYHAGNPLPHAANAIQHLRMVGKRVFFVTNTSSRSREQLQTKLEAQGINCEAVECVPSGVFTADYVRKNHPSAKRVYVVGGQGVVDELSKVGVEAIGGPAENDTKFCEESFKTLAETVHADRFDGVVVGWDTSLNYHKVVKSSLVFQTSPDAFFYATNDDPADRVGDWLLPGNGPLLAAIEASCKACAPHRADKEKPYGIHAEVLGKPNPAYAKLIAEWNGIDIKRTLMVGDRLDTDVLMGVQSGMGSLLVLTGVDSIQDIERKRIEPTFILPSVGCFWTERLEPLPSKH